MDFRSNIDLRSVRFHSDNGKHTWAVIISKDLSNFHVLQEPELQKFRNLVNSCTKKCKEKKCHHPGGVLVSDRGCDGYCEGKVDKYRDDWEKNVCKD